MAKLKPLESRIGQFNVIEDLGTKYPKIDSKHKKRYIIIECALCKRRLKKQYSKCKSGAVKCICSGGKMFRVDNKSRRRILHIRTTMIHRCENKNDNSFKHYGARGIKICKEWRTDREAFYKWALANGYSDTLSIERVDNDKGYSPDNCIWATHVVQMNNTQRTWLNKPEAVAEIGNLLFKGYSYQKINSLTGRGHKQISRLGKILINKYKEALWLIEGDFRLYGVLLIS